MNQKIVYAQANLQPQRRYIVLLLPFSEMSDDLFTRIESVARSRMALDSSGHDWSHVKRVNLLAMRIGSRLKANLLVLGAASLLHDLGVEKELKDGYDHAKASAEMGKEILKDLGFPEELIPNVVDSIMTHRFGSRMKAATLEAKILQDADRIDALGAIGIARAFAYGGARGYPIYDATESPGEYDPHARRSTVTHIREKLLKIRDSLNTEEAMAIAAEREKFVKLFLDRFLAEFRGEDVKDLTK